MYKKCDLFINLHYMKSIVASLHHHVQLVSGKTYLKVHYELKTTVEVSIVSYRNVVHSYLLEFFKHIMQVGLLYLKIGEHSVEITAPNCIKQFHWLILLIWPIRFDITIVSIGNNCNVKPNLP